MTDAAVIQPSFHHVNLKTTRLQEMVDWYGTVLGVKVQFQAPDGAWLTNDQANHRVALLAFDGFKDDPEKDTRTGMHHSAFEYDSFEELNASYLRLRDAGITPDICLDHGMTFSYYYKDPDGNYVELQCDIFGDWAKSSAVDARQRGVPLQPDGHLRRPGARRRGRRRWRRPGGDPRARKGERVLARGGPRRDPLRGVIDAPAHL